MAPDESIHSYMKIRFSSNMYLSINIHTFIHLSIHRSCICRSAFVHQHSTFIQSYIHTLIRTFIHLSIHHLCICRSAFVHQHSTLLHSYIHTFESHAFISKTQFSSNIHLTISRHFGSSLLGSRWRPPAGPRRARRWRARRRCPRQRLRCIRRRRGRRSRRLHRRCRRRRARLHQQCSHGGQQFLHQQ